MSTPRKTFDDLKVDRDALTVKVSGTSVDKRTCSCGANPRLGCLECWVGGWLFDDRRNPAHPYFRRRNRAPEVRFVTVIG